MAIVLYWKANKLYKFVQSAVGLELWRQGCSAKAFQLMHQFGVTQGVAAARAHADEVGKDYNKDILTLKGSIEHSLTPADGDVQLRGRRRLVFPQNDGAWAGCAYSLGWDNVQIKVHCKHQGLENSNKFLMWAMCFAVVHRQPTLHMQDQDTIKAVDVTPNAFLPSEKDWDTLRQRQVIIVMRILADNLPCFHNVGKYVVQHIPHAHSKELAGKSHVINLGVIEANPASIPGALDIMDHLNQYVPSVQDGTIVHACPCNGDQLSVERMKGGKKGRVIALTPKARLDGLCETPQEFHKEGILLQVFWSPIIIHTS